jgi:O-antigen/teichoic acid export membrane protein
MQERWTLFLARIPGGKLLTGGALLFVSMTIVNAGNYLFNLILGRLLGPAAFADLSLIVTLLLVLTLVTSALQLVAAKFAAVHTANNDPASLSGLRRWLSRWAWGVGGALLLFFALGAPWLQAFFRTQSLWPFVLFGIGVPIYFAQGVDRGLLQGQTRFGVLALTYQAEMWVRLIAALGFVAIGWSVNGAVAGLTLSLVATWLVARSAAVGLPPAVALVSSERTAIMTFVGPAVAALVGQVLITNSDILIVKRYFEPVEAGQYAALALIGRIVFFATFSVVSVMFPIVAQKHEKGEPHRYLFGVSLLLVGVVSAGIIIATAIVPELIVSVLFGAAYVSIAPMLWLLAVATTLYALSNVVINYRLSTGFTHGTLIAVATGVLQVIALLIFHDSLIQVVSVLILVNTALFGTLLAWDVWLSINDKGGQRANVSR